MQHKKKVKKCEEFYHKVMNELTSMDIIAELINIDETIEVDKGNIIKTYGDPIIFIGIREKYIKHPYLYISVSTPKRGKEDQSYFRYIRSVYKILSKKYSVTYLNIPWNKLDSFNPKFIAHELRSVAVEYNEWMKKYRTKHKKH